MPCFSIINLFKSIKLLIIGAAIRVYLWLQILLKCAAHDPFAVDEATVPNQQSRAFTIWSVLITLFTDWAYALLYFSPYRGCCVASGNYNKLLVHLTFFVHAVTKPAEAIVYLSVPGILILPIDFLNIFYSIKGEINSKADLWWHYFWTAQAVVLVQIILSKIKLRQVFLCLTKVQFWHKDFVLDCTILYIKEESNRHLSLFNLYLNALLVAQLVILLVKDFISRI